MSKYSHRPEPEEQAGSSSHEALTVDQQEVQQAVAVLEGLLAGRSRVRGQALSKLLEAGPIDERRSAMVGPKQGTDEEIAA